MKLPVLCPQLYVGTEMRAVGCTKCDVGWDDTAGECRVEMGCEHLPLAASIPVCPLAARCRHDLQCAPAPCPVRARGMVCESALVYGGLSPEAAFAHPNSFSAITVAGVEDSPP